MERYEKIKKALESMDTEEIIAVHNEYCAAVNSDRFIYSMEDFDEIMEGVEPWEIARTCYYGEFRPACDYFRFNAYGNAESFDFADDPASGIYIDGIAEYIDRTGDNLYNDEIAEILEEETEAAAK